MLSEHAAEQARLHRLPQSEGPRVRSVKHVHALRKPDRASRSYRNARMFPHQHRVGQVQDSSAQVSKGAKTPIAWLEQDDEQKSLQLPMMHSTTLSEAM